MSRAVAIGSETRLAGYALAGVEVIAAEDAAMVAQAIGHIAGDVLLVILSEEPDAAAHAALERRPGTVWCALPM